MMILHHQGHATTNLFPRCGVTPETIQHLYQCTHKGIRDRWKVSLDALRKWFECQNMDPDITILLADTLLYITGEINKLTQCHIKTSFISAGHV